MRVLFISGEMIAADLAYRLKLEGCDVKLFIDDKSRKDCFEGMVEKTDNWRKELKWVGKDGLIVFDDIGYGSTQDDLRSRGFKVVGGSEGGERLERDRQFGQKIMSECGIKPLETHNFSTVEDAIAFIKTNQHAWVLKQNGHNSAITYVGLMPDGSDVLSVLESHIVGSDSITSLSLQKKVDGVEIAAGRYFNGKDWIGPIEMNIEHKKLFNGDLGPQTGEMGTLTWYEEKENNLFRETLGKIKPYLQATGFRGDIDINCIINKKLIYPLEITARFGCPAIHLQEELHCSPWKEFLSAVANGEKYDLKYKKGFGLVVSVAVPPFPYKITHKKTSEALYSKGVSIFFKGTLRKDELERIHFEEISMRETNGEKKYYISGNNGYAIYITGSGRTVAAARKKAYGLLKKIILPKMFFRTDIGINFSKRDARLLKGWGWI